MEWMLLPYKRYADFSGRSRRKEYWMFTLFYWLVIVALVALLIAFNQVASSAQGELGIVSIVFAVTLAVFFVGSIVPSIAVVVRRFHDQDKSGWMFLLNFVPYIGGFIVLIFMCIEGTRGENGYGPDPKEDFDESVFA